MAFFNLTQLGFQDTIKERCRPLPNEEESNEQHVLSDSNLPKDIRITSGKEIYKPTVNVHGNSYNEFSTLRTKHKRIPYSPEDLYREPQSCAMNNGWLHREIPLHSEKSKDWEKSDRFPIVQSEMTRPTPNIRRKA